MNKRFDVTGNEILRVFKHNIIGTVIPFGNLGGGPSLKCLLLCYIFHYFGRPLAWFALHFHTLVHRFYKWLQRRQNKNYFSEQTVFEE